MARSRLGWRLAQASGRGRKTNSRTQPHTCSPTLSSQYALDNIQHTSTYMMHSTSWHPYQSRVLRTAPAPTTTSSPAPAPDPADGSAPRRNWGHTRAPAMWWVLLLVRVDVHRRRTTTSRRHRAPRLVSARPALCAAAELDGRWDEGERVERGRERVHVAGAWVRCALCGRRCGVGGGEPSGARGSLDSYLLEQDLVFGGGGGVGSLGS